MKARVTVQTTEDDEGVTVLVSTTLDDELIDATTIRKEGAADDEQSSS